MRNALGRGAELVGRVCLLLFLGSLWSVLRAAEGPAGWLAPSAFGGASPASQSSSRASARSASRGRAPCASRYSFWITGSGTPSLIMLVPRC